MFAGVRHATFLRNHIKQLALPVGGPDRKGHPCLFSDRLKKEEVDTVIQFMLPEPPSEILSFSLLPVE